MSMPKFLSRMRRPRHAPQTGPFNLTREHFKTMTYTAPAVSAIVSKLLGVLTPELTKKAVDDYFSKSLEFNGRAGWTPGWKGAGDLPHIRLNSDEMLNQYIGEFARIVDMEIMKIDIKKDYVRKMKARALNGELKTALDQNELPEAQYYNAAGPRVAAPGAPPIPAPSDAMTQTRKAAAFVQHGVDGGGQKFGEKLREMMKTDGSFPLGSNERLLMQTWPQLVNTHHRYRGWDGNVGATYPSDAGGRAILNWILLDMTTTAMPARGSDRWYDLGLYVFGSIVASQPFLDGNKRMGRLCYALMLLSGGVPFRAFNNALGSQLAAM